MKQIVKVWRTRKIFEKGYIEAKRSNFGASILSTKTSVLGAPKLNKKTNQKATIKAKVHSRQLAVTVFRFNQIVTKKLASGVPNQAAQADGNSRWRMSRANQTVIDWT